MRNFKKFTALLCAAAMLASLVACGSGAGSMDNQTDSSAAADTAEDAAADTAEDTAAGTDTAAGENVLVAYFSHTGNTEAVAQQIADYTGGTLAQIERAVPYENVQTEGEEELNNGTHPEITFPLDSIEEYDTIFIGYPIWWDEAPMVISTFLESYDFSGKTIVPFCTSASDSIDNSLHIFEELAPDAELAEGLTANNEEKIEPWLAGLGF